MTTPNDDIIKAIRDLETSMGQRIDGLGSDMRQQFKDVNDKLNNLLGEKAERETHANIVNLAQQYLNMRMVSVLKSAIAPMDFSLQRSIDASEGRRVSKDECDDLRLADIIISGRRGGDTTHAVIEISIKANENDVRRAYDRASILDRVLGNGGAIPAVVCGSVDEEAMQIATVRDVHVIRYGRLRQE